MCFEWLLQAFARWQPGILFDTAVYSIHAQSWCSTGLEPKVIYALKVIKQLCHAGFCQQNGWLGLLPWILYTRWTLWAHVWGAIQAARCSITGSKFSTNSFTRRERERERERDPICSATFSTHHRIIRMTTDFVAISLTLNLFVFVDIMHWFCRNRVHAFTMILWLFICI